jgi:hypothetical protein
MNSVMKFIIVYYNDEKNYYFFCCIRWKQWNFLNNNRNKNINVRPKSMIAGKYDLRVKMLEFPLQ